MTPFASRNKITSPFGARTSPITGGQEQHRGQDITAPDGNWQVRECTGGTVIRVGYDNSRGNYVDVRTSPRHFERCQHMESIAVRAGQAVPQGTVLGMAGSTGASTGRHLHFGVYAAGPETDGYTALAQINTLERFAVEPSAWSDVPNQTGTHPGNNNLDAAPAG